MSDNTQYPANWQISGYDPNEHMMLLKGRDYLNVQNRLLWFIRDQRDFIVRGLATTSYVIRTELVEHDRDAGYAQFRTYVRDVMGNEATMYGSEAAKDFADYAEKASTKSLGRALLALGYGTAAAPEMDEGDRVVDAPVEHRQPPRTNNPPARPASPPARRDAPRTASDSSPRHQATPAASQAHGTQDTSAVDPMALTYASALDQKRLYGQMAARFKPDSYVGFLRSVTGRDLDPDKLRDGRSDLSLDEFVRVSERLTRPAGNGKAAAQ